MKTLFGIMGFAGFVIAVFGAGAAEGASFMFAVISMIIGISLLCASLALNKSYNLKRRHRRLVYMHKASSVKKEYMAHSVTLKPGVARIIGKEFNSPELC